MPGRALSTRVFGLPAVQAIVAHKWNTWARRLMLYEFAAYLVWLLAFQVFIWAFQVSHCYQIMDVVAVGRLLILGGRS